MTYFPKVKTSKRGLIIPSITLPLIYKDSFEANLKQVINKAWFNLEDIYYTNEIPLSLYIATWRLSSLMIADLIEEKIGYEKNNIELTSLLTSDLGADSLDIVEIALYLEKTVGIPIHEGLQFKRVSDLIDYVFSIIICRIQKSNLGWPKKDLDILANW